MVAPPRCGTIRVVNRRIAVLGACLLLGGCAQGASPRLSTPPGASPTIPTAATTAATKAATTTTGPTAASGLDACGALPREAWETVSLVELGGPFPYPDNDDKRFGNYEGALPKQKSGYYREYTVGTPGINHRGARRIVTGGGADGDVDEWFYTADHYETFCEISTDDVTNNAARNTEATR